MHNNCFRGLKFNSIEQSPFSQWESRSSCGVSEEPGGLPKQGDLSLYFSTLKDNSLSLSCLMILRRIVNWLLHSMQRERETAEIWGHRRNLSGSGPGGPSPLLADLVRGTKSARTPAVCGKVEGPCGVAWWTAGKNGLRASQHKSMQVDVQIKRKLKTHVVLLRACESVWPGIWPERTLLVEPPSLCEGGSASRVARTAIRQSFLPKSVTSCGASLVLVHLTGFCFTCFIFKATKLLVWKVDRTFV